MRGSKNALVALGVLGGIFAWANRFEIQRRLEARGIKTPQLGGDWEEKTQSKVAQVGGRIERGIDKVQKVITRKAG